LCYLFPLPFLFLGGLVLYFGLRDLSLAQLSADWPAVPGTVKSSGISWSHGDDSDSAFAKVVYTYEVEGISHTSDQFSYGDYGSSDTSHADSIVSRYAAGQSVTVYYDPLDPSKAVLERGANFSSYITPALGGSFVLVGVAMLCFFPSLLASADNRGSNPLINQTPPGP
jgi:hypothetical protein